MRQARQKQLNLVTDWLAFDHAKELQAIAGLLDEHPMVAELVLQDLALRVLKDAGAEGLSAEQILRALIIKQLNGFSYRELAFHLADSVTYRSFCQLGWYQRPSKSVLASCIKAIRAETLEKINRLLVGVAREKNVERGSMGLSDRFAVIGVRKELTHYMALARRVMNQTERRVFDEETVPSIEKVVSIFEEHTDIIVKDRRETLYGHKICLTSGRSTLVTDCTILKGNPADSTLAEQMIDRHIEITGKPPRQAAYDGGFTSKANLVAIKAKGVEDVAFSKARALQITDMVRSSWVYKKLRDFRAGIEGTISFLKRVFGLDRCTWRSLPSFHSYVWSSLVTFNLLVIARHQLA